MKVLIDANALTYLFGRVPAGDKCDAACCATKVEDAESLENKVSRSLLHTFLYTAQLYQEYRDTLDFGEFHEWWTATSNKGKLTPATTTPRNRALEKRLRGSGVANTDRRHICAAEQTADHLLVSEDIDMWSPPEKSSRHARKETVKQKNLGDVTRILRDFKVIRVNLAQSRRSL